MKKFKLKHAFAVIKFVRDFKIQEMVNKLIHEKTKGDEEVSKEKAVEIGFEVLQDVMFKIGEERLNELYQLIASLLDRNSKEIEDMDISEIATELVEISNIENWKKLLQLVKGQMKSK